MFGRSFAPDSLASERWRFCAATPRCGPKTSRTLGLTTARTHQKSPKPSRKTKPTKRPVFRLYSNENFPLPVVEELRRLGCDITTVTETGRAGQAWPDEEVLAYAIAESRALLTINRKHFFRLHRTTPAHAGIIACTFDTDFAGQAARIHSALTTAEGQEQIRLVRTEGFADVAGKHGGNELLTRAEIRQHSRLNGSAQP